MDAGTGVEAIVGDVSFWIEVCRQAPLLAFGMIALLLLRSGVQENTKAIKEWRVTQVNCASVSQLYAATLDKLAAMQSELLSAVRNMADTSMVALGRTLEHIEKNQKAMKKDT